MPDRIIAFRVLAWFLLISLVACSGLPVEVTAVSQSTPIAQTTAPANILATPYAQQPAAGICASFDGTVVTVTINADISDPRCTKVQPDQSLVVVNNTLSPLVVTIGRFTANVEPGEKTVFDTPFGEYVEPGVHQLQVSPCCGAELWLETTK
jgi:hypothetical protein